MGSYRSARASWLVLALAQLAQFLVHGAIYQSSTTGNPAQVTFDMEVVGGASECTPLNADGTVTTLDVLVNFASIQGTDNAASDMFLAINLLNAEGQTTACAQYGGYTVVYPGCTKYGDWPENWQSGINGAYTATVDATAANLAGSAWVVCIGNGYSSATSTASYDGTVTFAPTLATSGDATSFAPTLAPTDVPAVTSAPTAVPTFVPTFAPTNVADISVTSDCNQIVEVDFNAVLDGSQSLCTTFLANETLSTVVANITFGGSDQEEYASDLSFVLIYQSTGTGIQIGGYALSVAKTQYVGKWPASWDSTAAGIYTASVDVSAYNINYSGSYQVCVYNGFSYGTDVSFEGSFVVESLVKRCDLPYSQPPTVAPTQFPQPTEAPEFEQSSEKGDTTTAQFEVEFSGGVTKCIGMPSVGIVSNVVLTLGYTGSLDSWPSDLIVSVSNGTSCFYVGGYDVLPQNCNGANADAYTWPTTMNSAASGTYSAAVDVGQSRLIGNANVEVCIVNGYAASLTVGYDGIYSLTGFTSTVDEDNDDDDDDDDSDFAIYIIAPIVIFGALACVLLVCMLRSPEVFFSAPSTEFEDPLARLSGTPYVPPAAVRNPISSK